jgi:hypothetical protein
MRLSTADPGEAVPDPSDPALQRQDLRGWQPGRQAGQTLYAGAFMHVLFFIQFREKYGRREK